MGIGSFETCMWASRRGIHGLAFGTVPEIDVPAVRHYSCRP